VRCRFFILPIGFGGGLLDPDTGLVHLGAREYDPSIGRFIQPDPLGYAGGDVDVYGYCLDDPINLLDPMGLEPIMSGTDKDMLAQQTGKESGGADGKDNTSKGSKEKGTAGVGEGDDKRDEKVGVGSICVGGDVVVPPRRIGGDACVNADAQGGISVSGTYRGGAGTTPGVSAGVSAGVYTANSVEALAGKNEYVSATVPIPLTPAYLSAKGVRADQYEGVEVGAGVSFGVTLPDVGFGGEYTKAIRLR